MKLLNSKLDTSTSVLFDTPGPRAKAMTRWFNIGAIVLLAAFMAYVLSVMGAKGQLEAWARTICRGFWRLCRRRVFR